MGAPLCDQNQLIFKAIADPNRRLMLDAMLGHEIDGGEMSASELVGRLNISQPAVSQHLQILKDAGLVVDRRAGRKRFYTVQPEKLDAVSGWIAKYQDFWTQRFKALDAHLATKRN